MPDQQHLQPPAPAFASQNAFSCAASSERRLGRIAKPTMKPAPARSRQQRIVPRCLNQSAAGRCLSSESCGVTVRRYCVFNAGKAAEITRETAGEVISRQSQAPPASGFSSTWKSLPTGIIVSPGRTELFAHRFTASYKPASSPGDRQRPSSLPTAFTRLSAPICVAAMLVSASPTARRAEAAKSSSPPAHVRQWTSLRRESSLSRGWRW